MKNNLIITNNKQLELILTNSDYEKIEVNLPKLNKDYNNYWTAKIEKVYRACGCKTGFNFMLSGLTISLVLIFLFYNSFAEKPFIYLGKLLLFSVVLSALGKGIGILIAKKRLRQYVEEIKKSC